MKEYNTAKQLISPIISMISFMLLLVGASYAYYSQTIGSTTGTSNIANANITIPRGCTFIANATNCTISSNETNEIGLTDNYISRGEMVQTYAGNMIAQNNCSLNIGVQGTANCRCTSIVQVVGESVANYVADSIRVQLTSTNTSHSQSLRSVNTITNTISKLKVATSGTAVYENFALNLKAYNINSSQDNQSGVSYVYYLRATPLCSVTDETYTVTFDANGGTTSTTSKYVVYGEEYGELPQPSWSGHTFLGWNGKNVINKAASSRTEIQNETPVSLYGSVIYTNAWVIANLEPSTAYTVSFDIVTTEIPTNTGVNGSALGIRLYSGVSGYSTINCGYATQYLGLGQHKRIVQTCTTPATVGNTAANYRLILYTNRYTNNGTNVYAKMIVSNLMFEKGTTASIYEPYYVTEDTIVSQRKNHTLVAKWS